MDVVCVLRSNSSALKTQNPIPITYRTRSLARNSLKSRHLPWEELWWCQKKLMSKSIRNLCVYTLCSAFIHSSWFANYFFGASTLIYILFDLYFHLKSCIDFFCASLARILLCGGSLVEKINFYVFFLRSQCAFLGRRKFGNKASIAGAKSRLIGCFVSKWQGEAQKSQRKLLLAALYRHALSPSPLWLTQRA